jgi:hypothetical protein
MSIAIKSKIPNTSFLKKLQVLNLANMDFGETKFAVQKMNHCTRIAKSQVNWCFALGFSSPVAKWKEANQSFTPNSRLS